MECNCKVSSFIVSIWKLRLPVVFLTYFKKLRIIVKQDT
ncbi:unnamed protein product [Brassica oleracea]